MSGDTSTSRHEATTPDPEDARKPDSGVPASAKPPGVTLPAESTVNGGA